LFLFGYNIKNSFCDVLDFLLLFLKIYEKRKTHYMFLSMLDPQFKSFFLVSSSFIGCEEGNFIVENYD
jgi:hypothetical protein